MQDNLGLVAHLLRWSPSKLQNILKKTFFKGSLGEDRRQINWGAILGKLETTIDFARSLNHNGASTSSSGCLKLCQKMKAFMAYFFVKFEIVCDENPSVPDLPSSDETL